MAEKFVWQTSEVEVEDQQPSREGRSDRRNHIERDKRKRATTLDEEAEL